jgi:hypothetical protein
MKQSNYHLFMVSLFSSASLNDSFFFSFTVGDEEGQPNLTKKIKQIGDYGNFEIM